MQRAGLDQRNVLFREDGLLAVNKPAGMPVHGSRILEGSPRTLLTQVRGLEGKLMHVAHRLDRPVSGVMLFADNRELLAGLGRSFDQGEVEKTYLSIARGWTEPEGEIAHPLLPPKDVRRPGDTPRESLTRYERIANVEVPVAVGRYATARYSLLALYPKTGRRHQLRMHLKHVSHPLVGDTTYGRGEHNRMFRERMGCRRLLLHAWTLVFNHPGNGRRLRIHAPLDDEFGGVVEALGWTDALRQWEERAVEEFS